MAYAQALAAWEAIDRLQAPVDVGRVVADSRAVAENHAATSTLSRRSLLRAAAMALPVIAGGGLLWQMMDGPAYAATATGEQRRFNPVPGITLVLNTSSRIGWQMSDDYCELWLEQGEAALVLSGGTLKKALLHCGDRTLFLGTGEYNLRRHDDGTGEVLVLAGNARIAGSPASGASATAGEGKRIQLSSVATRVEAAPLPAVDAASAWRRGEVVFSGETLGAAIGEYNRYLDRKLVIDDPAVRALRIGGRFETLRPDSFLSAIASTFDLKAVDRPETILIERN